MTRRPHRLPRWLRRCLVASGTLLLVTGALWLALHYTAGAGAGELPHPLEAWSMRLHGAASFVALFTFGALAAAHVPQGWHTTQRQREPTQRRLGIALCTLAAALAASAYALYYFAPEWLRPGLGIVHASLGGVAAVVAAWHARRRGLIWRRKPAFEERETVMVDSK